MAIAHIPLLCCKQAKSHVCEIILSRPCNGVVFSHALVSHQSQHTREVLKHGRSTDAELIHLDQPSRQSERLRYGNVVFRRVGLQCIQPRLESISFYDRLENLQYSFSFYVIDRFLLSTFASRNVSDPGTGDGRPALRETLRFMGPKMQPTARYTIHRFRTDHQTLLVISRDLFVRSTRLQRHAW